MGTKCKQIEDMVNDRCDTCRLNVSAKILKIIGNIWPRYELCLWLGTTE